MADNNVVKFRIDTKEYDANLKRAGQALSEYMRKVREGGGSLKHLDDGVMDAVNSLNNMGIKAESTRGRIAEMTKTFTELRMQYKQMSAEEKASPVGKALDDSLKQLNTRIQQTKTDLRSVEKELSGSKFGQFGSIIDGIGQKMGLNANITELVTSKTALMTAGIGASVAIIGKATEAWASYNAELSKQDQVTQVTTGLRGPSADRMTDVARAMVDTYNVDFREVINAANTLMTQFGKSGDEAMQLIKDGMQGMIQGDGPKLLSMIQQFAPSFRDAGISASQLVAIIHNSEGGIFTDQNMNAIVMGIKNIRLMTKATSDALAKMGIDGQEMTRKLNDGTLTIFQAMQQVTEAIKRTGTGTQAVGEVMQYVFGRQGAAAGTNLGKAIATLNTNLEETKRQTGELGDAFADLQTANEKLNTAIRDCFEYDGWEQMAKGIQSKLVTALAAVIQKIADIKGALGGFSVSQQQGDSRNGGGANLEKNISMLGNGKGNKPQDTFRRQMQEYSRVLFRVNDQIADLQRKAGEDMDGNMAMVYEKQIRTLENRRAAIQRNMNEYERRARELFNKANGNEDTTKIDPITPTDTTKSKGTNPREQAAKQVKDAQAAYAQAIEKATLEFDAGRATEADVKRKTYDAQMQLWQAYGKAYDTYADPKYKQAQDECADKIKQLGGEVTASAEAQKKQQEAARQLEQAQKRVADAMTEAQTAYSSNDLKGYMAAQKKVGGDVNQGIVTGAFTFTGSNLEAFTAKLKEDLSKADLGSELYNQLTAQLADATALGNVMQVAIKNGIDTAQFDPQELWKKIFGENPGDYIEPETWQSIMDGLNKELKGKGKKATFDTNTGSVSVGRGKPGDRLEKFNNDFSKMTGGIGNIASGIQSLGVELPQELQSVLGVLNGISSIMTGILALVTLIQIDTKATAGASIIDAIVPLARGGIVPYMTTGGVIPRAAFGRVIPGNSFSGDNIFAGGAMVNSGELVLNKAQQGNLASTLRGGFSNIRFELVARGEQLRMVMNNNGKRTGKGELATWK